MSPRHDIHRAKAGRSFGRLAVLAIPFVLFGAEARAADDVPSAAPTAPSARLEPTTVLVLRFTRFGDATAADMGAAMSETLSAELTASRRFQPVRPGNEAKDADGAVSLAKEKGARYVVFGSVQVFGDQLRVTGQVVDAQTSKPIAFLRGDGGARQFLTVQDAITQQVHQALTGGGAASAPAPAARDSAPPPAYGSATATAPARTPALSRGSYWSEYMELYEPAPAQAPVGAYPAYPPTPPPPPIYGGGYGVNPYAFGGGSVIGDGVFVVAGGPPVLGTVRTERFNTLGHSIVGLPHNLSNTGYVTYGMMRPGAARAAIPKFNPGIGSYVNPHARFAAPVGMPQRAAPPNLRPGATSPASISAGSVLRSAAKK